MFIIYHVVSIHGRAGHGLQPYASYEPYASIKPWQLKRSESVWMIPPTSWECE